MKTIIYTLLSLVLLFSACKMTKQTVKTETAVTESVQFAVLEEKNKKTQENILTTRTDQTQMDDQTDTKTTVIKLSEPDVNGEQYILEIAVKEENKRTATAAITEVEQQVETTGEANEKNIDNSTSETNSKFVTDIKTDEKTRQPAWLYTTLIAGCLLAGFIIYRYLKW